MRRSNSEIKDINEILKVIGDCDVCRLGLNDEDGMPYIVPLNFAYEYDNGTLRLYFHSALEGKKLSLMARDSRAAFEMDCGHELVYKAEKQMCTMLYQCVMGKGRITMLEGTEKEQTLDKLMLRYHPDGSAVYNHAALERTCVYCLTADEFTCKHR